MSEVELVSVEPDHPAPPPAPRRRAAGGGSASASASARRTVRVRTELLDYFLDTVGELLLATARIREVGKALPEASRAAARGGASTGCTRW